MNSQSTHHQPDITFRLESQLSEGDTEKLSAAFSHA